MDEIVEHINPHAAADNLPDQTVVALAAQSMAQALAIATTDATTLLRNIETSMATVQSAALTRWIEAGSGEEDPRFQVIVRAAGQVMVDAVALWREINTAAQQLLQSLSEAVERPEPGERGKAPTPGEVRSRAKKKVGAAKRGASKKVPVKKPSKKAAQKAAQKAAKKKQAAKKPATKKRPTAAKPSQPKPVPTQAPVPDAANE